MTVNISSPNKLKINNGNKQGKKIKISEVVCTQTAQYDVYIFS